jgi:hypothetical protein
VKQDARRYFIVKHGLDAFEKLPDFIWNTAEGPRHPPHRYKELRPGDRWIGFAYTTSDRGERPLSLVTGFSKCVKKASYGPIPREARDECEKAWLIEGKRFGEKLRHPVGVPPIHDLLGKGVWNNQAITPITKEDFVKIEKYVRDHQFNPGSIPLLGREPHNEQELLAVVASGHKKLGIEKFIRLQTAFPDLLVKLHGKREEVHLELEIYSQSYRLHGHHKQVRNCRCKKDDKDVAILCWIDNDKRERLLKGYVHDVYELQSLLREGKKIRW